MDSFVGLPQHFLPKKASWSTDMSYNDLVEEAEEFQGLPRALGFVSL